MFRATMEQFRKGYGGEVNGEKEEKEEEEEEKEEETMASLHEPPSSPTLPHIEDLRELPKSSQTSAPPHSILEPPITTTKKLIQGKGVLLKSNTKDSYVYHHELSAIISKNPVSKDDGDEQEEIILLAEMKEGLVAKSNTANTIVVCKSRIDANRLGRSLVKDKWIELHHTKVGKVWLFRIPHVRFLIGGRRPVDKCGICEEVIPQGKVAHGCVYTRDTFGDDCGDGENVPSSVNKKVRFALE
ncbi:hypothetical protein L873DRAFT_1727935 [Choiromyces venosus 120613-1]|uniref:Uncharacterized protein n=1 Tax=Choiromyces venosus 120613-1 TaxID=1336337 RepID=A0A3N4K5L9_9PEZI|nr:hypothetical protein L873DRAFT_1727935 [Choiromyces venosus 120613-1]